MNCQLEVFGAEVNASSTDTICTSDFAACFKVTTCTSMAQRKSSSVNLMFFIPFRRDTTTIVFNRHFACYFIICDVNAITVTVADHFIQAVVDDFAESRVYGRNPLEVAGNRFQPFICDNRLLV
ncbi:hypothetical protein D3C86_1100500 [compost metagenome]